MGTTPSRAKRERFEVTLRGLRYAAHPKNAPEAVGTVVPWSRVQIHGQRGRGAQSVVILDEKGDVIGGLWRCVAWAVPFSQRRAVRWALRRAQDRSLRDGTFDISERDVERPTLWVPAVICAGGAVAMPLLMWSALSGAPGGQGVYPMSLRVASVATTALWMLLCVGFASIPVWLCWRRLTANVRRSRFTSEGIEAETADGTVERLRWEDVRNVRGSLNVYVVESHGGVRLKLWANRSRFILEDWMRRHGIVVREPADDRRMHLRVFVLCQIGGAGMASLVGSGLIQHPRGPLAIYLVMGFVLPLFLWIAMNLDSWMESMARAHAVGRRRVRRAAGA